MRATNFSVLPACIALPASDPQTRFQVDLAPERSEIVERFLVGKEEDGWMVVPR